MSAEEFEYDQSLESAPPRAANIPMALVGAAIGALIGAAIWAGIALATDREFGILAIAIGGLAGLGAKLGGKSTGRPLQIIAVFESLIGLVVAKYAIIAGVLVSMASQHGTEIGYFDPKVMEGFKLYLTEATGIYDIVWVVVAVGVAWSVPSGD